MKSISRKVVLLTALTTALFADYCDSYVNLMNKESEKGIQYFKSGLYDMACFQTDTAIIFAINAKVECSNNKEIVKSIDNLINSMKGFKKVKCK